MMFKIVHVEKEYEFIKFMQKTTTFDNIESWNEMDREFNKLFPDHVVFSCEEMTEDEAETQRMVNTLITCLHA